MPSELIFSDPAFLHPLRGVELSGSALQFYAADLARGADGRWRVLDNHAETPAGIGFALANRIAVTHCEGNLFRNYKALRLAAYFQRLQDELVHRSGVENPLIAVLTPGADHSDYFSHSYIARYLGYQLVEGGDLVIQDGRISLKTLAGLIPINSLVRCVEGAKSDPLELEPDGFYGAAGLVQAARRNSAQICNMLGTAIVENRGLSPFLAAVCRHLLGEDLMLFEPDRWWLGDVAARDHVFANLPDMLISDAHEGTGRPGETRQAIDGASLSGAERSALKKRVALFGASMIAERKADFATTPTWTGENLEPRKFALRTFAARHGDKYDVMPGGLAMSLARGTAVGLHSPEGLTRDVWVLSDGKLGPYESLWRLTDRPADIIRTGRSLQSRIADNLFWLGRNAERAEWTLRLCRQALSRLEEDSGPEEDSATVIKSLSILINKDAGKPLALKGISADSEIERLVRSLLYGPDRAYGFQAQLAQLQRLAGLTRDRLSSESWHILNTFFTDQKWRRDPGFVQTAQVTDLADRGLMALAAFSGTMMENMTRSFAWRFLDMGRRIERAWNMAEFISQIAGMPSGEGSESNKRMMYILEVADSFITYRARYRILPALPAVIDLLLLDESNPRSLAFQMAALSEHVQHLPMEPEGGRRSEESRLILDLLSQLQLADSEALAQTSQPHEVSPLQELLQRHLNRLPQLTDILTKRYFAPTKETPHRIQTALKEWFLWFDIRSVTKRFTITVRPWPARATCCT